MPLCDKGEPAGTGQHPVPRQGKQQSAGRCHARQATGKDRDANDEAYRAGPADAQRLLDRCQATSIWPVTTINQDHTREPPTWRSP